MVLKSKIEVDMPCLTADLVKRIPEGSPDVSSDGGPLLEGQISTWTILLRNVGNAPASSAFLKTNLPWVNIVASESSSSSIEELEAQATSGCLGPTGTLVTLPMNGDELKETGTIHPGESVGIPIQIRTSGNGKQHFYMLYRYDLYDSNAESSATPRRRWLRKMYEVPVSTPLKERVFCFWSHIPHHTLLRTSFRCFLLLISMPRLQVPFGRVASNFFLYR